MSIRMLASELYRSMKEVEQLEKKLRSLGPTAPERAELEDRLRRAKVERNRLRGYLEGAKED